MSIDRDLQSAVEAVNELWSDDRWNAERYRQFTASVPRRKLERLTTALHSLRDTVDGAMYLAVYEEGEVQVVAQSSGPTAPPLPEWVAFREAAHALSFGKALLAQLDEDELHDHISRHRLGRLTSQTITSESTLRQRLQGMPTGVPFLDLREYAAGWVSAAMPVSGAGRPAALAVYMTTSHAHRLRSASDILAGAAVTLDLVLSPPITGEPSPRTLADVDLATDEAVVNAIR
ncbi:IclR family transcriptional regulator C-terminal domain-containing protein [Streptomyces bobili]|uniref:IclR family transcriptional regulator domain-containing protein n=1 Tax=Streptomyces bobili TaxID=67280 RepID=UPI0036ECFB04